MLWPMLTLRTANFETSFPKNFTVSVAVASVMESYTLSQYSNPALSAAIKSAFEVLVFSMFRSGFFSPVAADCVDGLEAVILLRHFFGGTQQNSLGSFIAVLVDGAERISGGLLFLSKGGQSNQAQQNYEQSFSHGFSFSVGRKG